MKRLLYLGTAITVFLFSLGAIDFWIFKLGEGSNALYNYWIAVGLTFVSFGVCLATIMWIANPQISPKLLWAVFLTPFILLVAGIWDWIIYFIYLRYGAPYPSYEIWSAQARWVGFWNWQLQLIWTIIFLTLLGLMWYKILKVHCCLSSASLFFHNFSFGGTCYCGR